MKISIIICSYNPNKAYIKCVTAALSKQTLPSSEWELILVDNKSEVPISDWIDLSWHPNATIVTETQAGLLFARLRGVSIAKTDLIIFVDDDNVLENSYLENCLKRHEEHPLIGVFGGKSLPIFETEPPAWFGEIGISLGCQDLGDKAYISNYANKGFALDKYPPYAPIGTGMVIQKKAFLSYAKEINQNEFRLALGRKGKSLASGEDNDIVLTLIKNAYELGYFPELIVKHLIPKQRLTFKYLKRMAYESNRSWVKVLYIHQISPWKKIHLMTLTPRITLSYFRLKAWKSKANYIKWRSACGLLKGLSELA